MDGEAKLPVRATEPRNLISPVEPSNPDSKSSSSSSGLSSSIDLPPYIQRIQAAFKRPRPIGPMASDDLKPRRVFAPARSLGPAKKPVVQQQTESMVSSANETQEDAPIMPPSILATTTNPFDGNASAVDVQMNQQKCSSDSTKKDVMPIPHVESQFDRIKKVQFSVVDTVISQGANEGVATALRNLSSHVNSLALTEMEWNSSSQMEVSNAMDHDLKQQTLPNSECSVTSKSDVVISSSLSKQTAAIQERLHQVWNIVNQPASQSSVMSSSCATTTSVHASYMPMQNSTYTSRSNRDEDSHMAVEYLGDSNLKVENINQGKMMHLPESSLSNTGLLSGQVAITDQAPMSSVPMETENNMHNVSKEEMQKMEKQSVLPNNPSLNDDKAVESNKYCGDVTNVNSQAPLTRDSTATKLEHSQTGKSEKVGSSKGAAAPRKRNRDSDHHFFKVNGKLYQRLGKIGSGGSSEVHKVISSECSIYALKKIKLKGRDYMTAYGFCQEIQYLNKLKGKDHIIQLIDYEVTDKTLLHEVMNGSMNNKDGRVKDDGYIYMVLEYGEIDLAHMLSQKWRKLDDSETIDENWLRFYWQQILQAVNTIHEERIVHSDLKPANFLLVKGSLKLIDFGIAKAIMSDTTNIQRDSQVGTLSYMSPEAFLCNETDANGNVIKCGRPSDIWSLGCILYQMVYGRTPFSDYKTFWSKFKVITDPTHEIEYEPIPNPLLLDIMKKCLAWDRNERWRIPELLEHPFLVPPPVTASIPGPNRTSENPMIRFIADGCRDNEEVSGLCEQMRKLMEEPESVAKSRSQDQKCLLLSQMSELCLQMKERLVKSDSEKK